MTKLYKAIDKLDNSVSCFLVFEKGVIITSWTRSDDEEIEANKGLESFENLGLSLDSFERRAIDLVLIAEW